MVNIHGLKLEFDSQSVWVQSYLKQIADIVFMSQAATNPLSGTVEIQNETSGGGTALRELEEGVFIGRETFYDKTYGVRVEFPAPKVIRLLTDRPAFEWLIWSLQLLALQNRAVFVHGAALERDGLALMFPSWGGVGKTALAAEFVRQDGWRLLGDDFTIVDESGFVYGFPKAMVLYPYHKPLFPAVFAAGDGPLAPTMFNEMLSRAALVAKPFLRKVPMMLDFARRHNPQSVRINPSDVFGPEHLSATARIQASVWLERRKDISVPEICEANGCITSRVFGSTINEFDPRCVRLTNTAMGLGMLRFDNYVGAWHEVLTHSLGEVPSYLLNIPVSLPVQRVPNAVRTLLEKHGVLCEKVS